MTLGVFRQLTRNMGHNLRMVVPMERNLDLEPLDTDKHPGGRSPFIIEVEQDVVEIMERDGVLVLYAR